MGNESHDTEKKRDTATRRQTHHEMCASAKAVAYGHSGRERKVVAIERGRNVLFALGLRSRVCCFHFFGDTFAGALRFF